MSKYILHVFAVFFFVRDELHPDKMHTSVYNLEKFCMFAKIINPYY
jgi:hypothetical protein